MSDPFTDWYDQLVDADTVTGAPGDWGTRTTVQNTNIPCRIESSDEVITGDGSEIRVKTLLLAAITELPKFTPGTDVHLPDGRVVVVLSVDSEASDPDLAGITVQLA